MSRLLLFSIVFIEGYCSLGAEVIALRRLLPFMGSAITVTAPTIGFFLLALALGYHAGGRVSRDFAAVVQRNFLISALIAGVGLASRSVDLLFASGAPLLLAYLLFISLVLCPLAWLLGQTVPVLTNLTRHERVGEASGQALFWSTLGSFLGAATLSVGVMQWLGVSAAVLLTVALLGLGTLLFPQQRWRNGAGMALILGLAWLLLPGRQLAETAYADYRVEPVPLPGEETRGFFVNNSLASVIDRGNPTRYARYVEHLRALLADSLPATPQSILVLGAGGFTLSHRESRHHYTFVDIDPAIKQLAEAHFLEQAAQGEFVVTDARYFLAHNQKQFAAVVVDVFSNRMSIPGHLVTREFWADSRRSLQPGGFLAANLILDARLQSDYARNLLATIESVYGRCAVEVLHKGKPVSNVIVSCHPDDNPAPPRIYHDELSRVDLDAARMP
jgi:predicted membrane-bound spermidine synthase